MGSRVMLTTVQSLEWPDTPCIPFFRQSTNEIVYISRNRDSFTFWVPILHIWGPILWFSYSFWQLGVGGPEKRTRNVQKSRTRKIKIDMKMSLRFYLISTISTYNSKLNSYLLFLGSLCSIQKSRIHWKYNNGT